METVVRHNGFGVELSGCPDNVDWAMTALNAHADLLAAAERVQNWLREYIGQHGGDPMDGGLAQMHNEINAAIARAKH